MLNNPGEHSAVSDFNATLHGYVTIPTSGNILMRPLLQPYYSSTPPPPPGKSCNYNCFASYVILFTQAYYSSMSLQVSNSARHPSFVGLLQHPIQ